MRKLFATWIFQAMLSLTVVYGADPIPRADGPVVVQPFNPFPTVPSQPDDRKDSTPKTDPDAVTVLPDEYLLIVKSEPEFILRASPKGKVDIIRAVSPQIGGRFVGGSGKFKLETFKEKNVAIVMKRPDATGLVELIYSPVGAKDESTDIARMVQLGTGPIPPPKPVVPDDDKKDDKKVVVKTFRVIMVYESGDTLPAAANSVLYGKAVEEFLNANCTGGKSGWARRDKDATGAYDADRQAVWDAVKDEFGPPKNTKTPALVIQVNDKITIEPFGATAAATVTLLKKYAEGK